MLDISLFHYQNHEVICRYCDDYDKPMEYGRDVFMQLLKWLHISNQLKLLGSTAFITTEINEIDKMWHTFILFTKDYELFCHKYFKYFIHHTPKTLETKILTQDEKRTLFRKYFSLIVQEFGRDTLVAWFQDKKYA